MRARTEMMRHVVRVERLAAAHELEEDDDSLLPRLPRHDDTSQRLTVLDIIDGISIYLRARHQRGRPERLIIWPNQAPTNYRLMSPLTIFRPGARRHYRRIDVTYCYIRHFHDYTRARAMMSLLDMPLYT